MLHIRILILTLDFTSIAVGSVGGALHARRHPRYNYDVVGVLGLALISSLGGGIIRDVLLQHGPPLAFVHVSYCYVACLAAISGLLLATRIGTRTERLMLYIDAASIASFAVAGAARAESFGLTWLPAVIIGIIAAIGGGSIRDVVSGSTPQVFERGNFYAIAAGLAAAAYLTCLSLHFSSVWCVVSGIVVGFALRILSVELDWRTSVLRVARRIT